MAQRKVSHHTRIRSKERINLDSVKPGDIIAEIETDKVVLEVLAPSDGKISKIHKKSQMYIF